MANSTVNQFPISSQGFYAITFDYLAKKFVVVTLIDSTATVANKVLTYGIDYTIPTDKQVEFLPSLDVSAYDTVQINRYTDTELLVDFRDGSVLTAGNLTTSELQAIHIAEEGRDVVAREVQPIVDGLNNLLGKAIRVSDTDVDALGDAAFRAGKVIAFDSAGKPALILPADGTASDVMLELAKPTGLAQIGESTGVNAQAALDNMKADISAAIDPNNKMKPQRDIFIGSFFNSNADVSMTLVKSYDGKSFSVMNKTPLLLPSGAAAGSRDPSIVYLKGYWYVAYTNANSNQDFSVMRSPDLISWTVFNCKAGAGLHGKPGSSIGGTIPTIQPIWAPSLFVDNGELYAQLSVGFKPQAPDKDGTLVNWCVPFSTKCTNLDTMTFDTAVQMMSDTSVQRIDVEVTKLPDGYMLLIKNEYSKAIELWKSSTYIGGYSLIASLDFGGRYVEGPSMVYINHLSTYRIYADAFRENGTTWYVDTKDFVTFTAPARVQCPNPMRHGTVYNMANSQEPAKAIDSFTVAASVMASEDISPKWAEGSTITAGSQALVPQCNYVYRVSGSINATVNINEKGGDYFWLLVASGSNGAGITVGGSKVDGSFSIGYGQTNLRLYKVVWNSQSGLYQLEGVPNRNGGSLAMNAQTGWPTITNAWLPKDGTTYATSGADSATTIASLPTSLPDGTYFHLWIGSGSTGGSIVLKSTAGNGMSIGGSDIVLSGATGHGDKLFTMKKVGGTWRLMAF